MGERGIKAEKNTTNTQSQLINTHHKSTAKIERENGHKGPHTHKTQRKKRNTKMPKKHHQK
jgi:hypothetical protein